MAELGAKICLDAGDLARMEHYLALAEATEPFNTRKRDRGFSINFVRKFRASNGLLDPADAIFVCRSFQDVQRFLRHKLTAGEPRTSGRFAEKLAYDLICDLAWIDDLPLPDGHVLI